VYRPNAQGEGLVRPNKTLVQKQSNPEPIAPKRGQQPAYAVQAPMPRIGGVQEIRVGLPASPGAVGFVRLRPTESGKVYISDLEVSPEHRRHGVASMLVQAALRAAAAQGRRGAVLEAMPGAQSISPESLVSMYVKLGFRQSGLSGRGRPLMEFGPSSIQRQGPVESPVQLKPARKLSSSHALASSLGTIQRAETKPSSKAEAWKAKVAAGRAEKAQTEGARQAEKAKSKGAPEKKRKEEELLSEIEVLRNTVHNIVIIVQLDSHQNKHQLTKIPQLKQEAAGGTKFPEGIDLAWHVANTAPIVMQWAKGYVATAVAGSVNGKSKAYSPKKNSLHKEIEFDVTAILDDGVYYVTYHCNPY
jgi:ribosomal protein S18 acetylase RimI-like enzyme